MSNDRELLELAAKALGGVCKHHKTLMGEHPYIQHAGEKFEQWWNPLTDDSAALRLAVKLKLRFSTVCNEGYESVASSTSFDINVCVEPHNGDPYAATRRAIVRAASEIGRSMTP